MQVITSGRTDVSDYFERSGIRDWKRLSHTPLLVFQVDGNTVTVKIVDNPRKLLEYPDDTKLMGQWRGEWRSDFFQFTVGQLSEHIQNNPPGPHRVI